MKPCQDYISAQISCGLFHCVTSDFFFLHWKKGSILSLIIPYGADISIGLNLKIPNLEPSEPPKIEPRTYRTSNLLLEIEPRTYGTS